MGLVSNIYKEHKKVDFRKSNNPIKKWVSELNKELSPEEYRMAEKHLKKCSTSLIIREMQIRFLFKEKICYKTVKVKILTINVILSLQIAVL